MARNSQLISDERRVLWRLRNEKLVWNNVSVVECFMP
jgi:hypothetical protein